MATSQATVDYILDQLVNVPLISARKMFGEYALYVGSKVVALVCDDILFVKRTEPGLLFVGDLYSEGFAYNGAKASMVIEEALIENRAWLSELVTITAEFLPLPKKKSLKKK